MRALPVRRIATTVLCASLLLGTAGPVVAAESDSPHGSAQDAPRAPDPDTAALLSQVETLSDAGGVLTPVTDLLTAVLKAEQGRLPAEEAEKLAGPAKDAITKASAGLPDALPDDDTPAAGDPKADALDAVLASVDALLQVVTVGGGTAGSGVGSDVGSSAESGAVPGVLTGLVNLLAATLVGGGLPAPDLAGLPSLPTAPDDAEELAFS